MNDSYWMVPVFFLAVFAMVALLMVGGKLEEKRIYDNCLENNKTMVHQDAVKLCKEIIK